jgi:hypothetical protein
MEHFVEITREVAGFGAGNKKQKKITLLYNSRGFITGRLPQLLPHSHIVGL